MATLLLRLVGPMQSWGTTSRFGQRDTGKEPSKSGVIGLLAAALGIDRENWTDLEPLTHLSIGVRHDRPGVLKKDYQTAGCAATDTIIKANGTQEKGGGVVSTRFYLADAAFLVGVESEDRSLLERIHNALRNPAWPLALGRKSYVPAEPVWIKDGLLELSLYEALKNWQWVSTPRKWESTPEQFLISLESKDGSGVLKMDQILSSFAERRFGSRLVCSEWVDFSREVTDVSA